MIRIKWIFYRVKRKTFDLTVISEGELEAEDEIEVKNSVEGKSTITFIVDEGSIVKKGDLLVTLSDDQIRKNIQDTELKRVQAISDNEKAKQDLLIAESEKKSTEDKADLVLALAELDLMKWKMGTVVQTTADLKVALEKSEETLKHRYKESALSEKLFAKDFISDAERYKDEIALKDAISNRAKTILDQKTYFEYTFHTEERKFNSDVSQAKSELQRTKERNQKVRFSKNRRS